MILTAFTIIYYRRYIGDRSFLSILRKSLYGSIIVLSAISVILFLLVFCNDKFPNKIKGNAQANSQTIAETVAFDKSFFSIAQGQKVDTYADFVAAEAIRLDVK